MLHLLDFSGRWDPKFLMKGPQPEEATEKSKKATHDAVMARAEFRLAKHVSRQSRTNPNPAQATFVYKYIDGTLLAEVNQLALAEGNCQLRLLDGGSVDIGGSTGGFARTVLYDWTPPDLSALEM